MKILLVDDSLAMRRIQKNVLLSLGFNDVIEAADGQEAMQKLKENNCELILSDWNMPVMDGLTFLKTVKADRNFKAIPVIMVTSESGKAQIIEAIKNGAANYVVKPFTKEIIQQKIQTVISQPPAGA